MKHTLLAISLGLVASTSAFAAPIQMPTLFGEANVSFDQVDNGTNSRGSIVSNNSTIGVKGSQKLEKGVNLFYQAAWNYNIDSNDATADLTPTERFVGLETAYGTVRAGSFFTAMSNSQYNSQSGVDRFDNLTNFDMAATLGVTGENLKSNSIGYTSPKFVNLITIDTQYSPKETVASSQTTDLYSAAIKAEQNGLSASIGADQFNHKTTVRSTVGYDTGAVSVGAMYQNDNGAYSDSKKTYLISAAYTEGKCVFKGQAGVVNPEFGSNLKVVTIGMDHNFNSNTTAYGAINYTSQDDANNKNQDTSAVSVGIKYRF